MISQGETLSLHSSWACNFDQRWFGCFEWQNTRPLYKQVILVSQKVITLGPNMGNADGKHTWVLFTSHMGTLRGKTHGPHVENRCIFQCDTLVAAHVWPLRGTHMDHSWGPWNFAIWLCVTRLTEIVTILSIVVVEIRILIVEIAYKLSLQKPCNQS